MTIRTSKHVDAVIVGAGFAGMYALHRLRDDLGFNVVVLERGSDVGGTWFWNRYPGARCDAESIFYSYSSDPKLEQTWTWSEKFATQPEILAYASHVADTWDLRRDIVFNTEVTSARYDDTKNRWTVDSSAGSFDTQYFITGIGCLSASRIPDIKGLESFRGEIYHTGRWPHEGVDLDGKRVAVIGTGSSGIQLIPAIAGTCSHLTVFQRTANFSVPARNAPLGPDQQARLRAVYPMLREAARQASGGQIVAPPIGSALAPETPVRDELDRRWAHGGPGFLNAFSDTMLDKRANEVSAEYIREQIRNVVDDPDTAELLCPNDHPLGSKRICVDTDYHATFNRRNVTLVDISSDPIERIEPTGPEVAGTTHEVDVIIFATGFDAMTGPFHKMRITGREGVTLSDAWSAGPRTYLGLAVHGFPNMFTITGPGSPSVLSNMLVSIEQHVDWISDYITFMNAMGIAATEPSLHAQDAWVQEVNETAARTLYLEGKSWYLGANIPGKPRVFMPYAGGVGTYRKQCELITAKGYAGFLHTRDTGTNTASVEADVPTPDRVSVGA